MKIIPYSFHVLHPFAVTIIGTNCHGINNCNLVLNTPVSRPTPAIQVEIVRTQQLQAFSIVPVKTELQNGAALLFSHPLTHRSF